MALVPENDAMKHWKERVIYDKNSPSGLVWKKNGKKAGYLNPNGYWYIGSEIKEGRISTLVHRVILYLNGYKIEGNDVDHIDGRSSNNLLDNLRVVETRINCRNSTMRSDNSTGVVGVHFEVAGNKNGPRWKACWVDISGKQRSKSFALSKYGEELAEFLAIEYRQHQIDLLNLMGAGYTERHGT